MSKGIRTSIMHRPSGSETVKREMVAAEHIWARALGLESSGSEVVAVHDEVRNWSGGALDERLSQEYARRGLERPRRRD